MKFNKYTNGLLTIAMALAATACDEDSWNDKLEGFEVPPAYSATETVSYTLTDANYSAIANNSTNKTLAEADNESDLLAAIGKSLEFPSEEAARKYIPAFLANEYYALNNGSNVKVTYNLAGNQPPKYSLSTQVSNPTLCRMPTTSRHGALTTTISQPLRATPLPQTSPQSSQMQCPMQQKAHTLL